MDSAKSAKNSTDEEICTQRKLLHEITCKSLFFCLKHYNCSKNKRNKNCSLFSEYFEIFSSIQFVLAFFGMIVALRKGGGKQDFLKEMKDYETFRVYGQGFF